MGAVGGAPPFICTSCEMDIDVRAYAMANQDVKARQRGLRPRSVPAGCSSSRTGP
jgi:hypothetical protein